MNFPGATPSITTASNDLLLLADVSNSNNVWDDTVVNVVKAWLWASTTDDLPQWATNLYFTSAEKSKLSWISPNAEPNVVDSVNGQIGIITLTQDDIGDGVTYKQTENNYSDSEVTKVTNATAHISDVNNPHNVTKTQVWLWNVTNDAQLLRAWNDYTQFTNKPSPNYNDIVLIEDSVSWYAKRKTTLLSILNGIGQHMKAFNTRVDKSLEVVPDKIQLKNDEAIPDNGKFYWQRVSWKWRYRPFNKTVIQTLETIQIENDESLVVSGEYKVYWNINIYWSLHII